MPSAKDDDSTDVESQVKKFIDQMNKACADLRKSRIEAQKKDFEKARKEAEKAQKDAKDAKDAKSKKTELKPPPDPPLITFIMDPSPVTKSRTPSEQAEQIVAGKSWVCWSAHMADRARHVMMKVDGKITWEFQKALGDDWKDFLKEWASAMSACKLKNANGGDGWYSGDEMHLEVPESKVSQVDERAKACLDEYARMTRKDGKKQNDRFEKDYAKLLKDYLSKYEKDDKKDAKKDEKKK